MHPKYQRRSTPHAERDLLSKRQTRVFVLPTTITRTLNFLRTDSVGSVISTVPVTETLTQTVTSSQVIESSSKSTPSSLAARTTSASVTLPTSTSTTTASPDSSQPSHTSTSSSSTLTISPTAGTDRNSNGTVPPSMAGGTIAAIFMACLIVVILAGFYLMRSRAKLNRVRRRPLWMRRTIDSPLGISSDSYEPKPPSYFESQHSQLTAPPPVPPLPQWAYPTVPPNAYNKETVVVNPAVITANPNLITTPSAVYILGPNGKRSAFEATVSSTFLTTYSDELTVEVGESLRVIAEYDDGWNLCMNKRGEQGMVPIECLDRGRKELQAGAVSMPVASLGSPTSSQNCMGRKRSSSLRP